LGTPRGAAAQALSQGYVVIITGDHGNAEEMVYADGKANPAHTTNKVPLIVLGLGHYERNGILSGQWAGLRSDSTITLQYQNMNGPKSATVGVENALGLSAQQYGCNGSGNIVHNELAIGYTTP
jgi:bisphosphoglycerate-independent phosphoglycerate mutase (AlkP superfamily)